MPTPLSGHLPSLPSAGLLIEIGALGGMFSDLAGTTPTADGGPVRLLRDQSGNGLNFSAALQNTPPLYDATGAGGTPEIPGGVFLLAQPTALSQLQEGQNHSLCLVFNSIRDTAQTFISKTATYADAGYLAIFGSGALVRGSQYTRYVAAGLHVLVVTYDAATNASSYYVNGSKRAVTSGTLGTLNTTHDWYLLSARFFAAWNRVLTQNEITAATRGLCEQFESPTAPHVLLVGNSLTQQMPLNSLADALPANTSIQNLGIIGATWADLASEGGAAVDGAIAAAPQSLIIGLGEWTNSAANGQTLQQLKDGFTAYLNARKAAVVAAGKTAVYVAHTALPSGYVANDQLRLDYNAWLRAQAPTQGFIVSDWASHPQMGGTGQNSNTTYFSDGTHLTPAGNAEMELIRNAAILQGVALLSDTTAPAVPTLTATYRNGLVNLSAVAPPDPDSAKIRFYRAGVQIAEVAATSGAVAAFTDSGRTNGTPYTYTARALDSSNNLSGVSAAVTVTPLELSAAAIAAIATAVVAKPQFQAISTAAARSVDLLSAGLALTETGYDVVRGGVVIGSIALTDGLPGELEAP